jgi:hypothetical protein
MSQDGAITGFEIELQIFEAVTRGGVRRVTWHVSEQDEWVSVAATPGAQLDYQDRGPGMVWRRQVRLRLPVGAELMRVESEPARDAPKDPLAYLWGARRGTERRVRRSYFRVGEQGKLLKLPDRTG